MDRWMDEWMRGLIGCRQEATTKEAPGSNSCLFGGSSLYLLCCIFFQCYVSPGACCHALVSSRNHTLMSLLRPMAVPLSFLLLVFQTVQSMPRSRSRSPLYSPSTDLCLDDHSYSSGGEAPVRRSRPTGRISEQGLCHATTTPPSIFTTGEGSWVQEPNVTDASQRLQAALVDDYQPSHHEFVDSLMNQVFSYQISPPLQRTLLLVYIQDHRDRLQTQRDSGLLWSTAVMCNLSFCANASCCAIVPHEQDIHLCQELVHPRTRMWRTSRWQELLTRRSKPKARRKRRVHRRPCLGLFAKSLFWPSFLHTWFLVPIIQRARVGQCTCLPESGSVVLAAGLWLRISLHFQAHIQLCQGLHAGLCAFALSFDVAWTRAAACYHYVLALLTAYVNWSALLSSVVRSQRLCIRPSSWRCWHGGPSLTSCTGWKLICQCVQLVSISITTVCDLLKKGQACAYEHTSILVQKLWQLVSLTFTVIQIEGTLGHWAGLVYCWYPFDTFWPCHFSRSRHHCKYVARCKYIVSYMRMMNSLVLWNPRQDRVLPCLKKFPLWPLGDRVQATIQFTLTRLLMTLEHSTGVRQDSLLGNCRHVPLKLLMCVMLMLSKPWAHRLQNRDVCVLPESGPPICGVALAEHGSLAKEDLRWWIEVFKLSRCHCPLYVLLFDMRRHLPPKMKLALILPLLPQMLLRIALGLRPSRRPHTTWTLTICLRLTLYILVTLRRCFALTATTDHLLRCVHILCWWKHQYAGIWYSPPAVKIALLFLSPWFVLATSIMHTFDHIGTQVAANLKRWVSAASLGSLLFMMTLEQAKALHDGLLVTYSLPWHKFCSIFLPPRLALAHPCWYGANLHTWLFSIAWRVLCTIWQDNVCYWAWNLAILSASGMFGLMQFGAYSGHLYTAILCMLASMTLPFRRALWYSVTAWFLHFLHCPCACVPAHLYLFPCGIKRPGSGRYYQ